MVLFPPCKINLGLYIQSRRPDGYHSILTCFYPIPWTDVLEVLPAKEFSFTQSGLELPGSKSENLCVKAHKRLSEGHKIPPLAIHLHKVIPPGAGLGGGSSDAASTLQAINRVAGLGLTPGQLADHAKVLGSDCAFFVDPKPSIGSGRGDELESINLDLKGNFILIVKPDIHISTADAYASVIPSNAAVDLAGILSTPKEWRSRLRNDFEPSLFLRHPAIAKLKESLYSDGAWYASMSGSGSAVFALFNEARPVERFVTSGQCWSGWL